MAKRTSIPPREVIAGALASFLARGKIHGVQFVRNADMPPPPLAYLLHIPRLSLTLSGEDVVRIGRDAAPATLKLPRGRLVVVPPNCWTRPLWSRPAVTMNLLFGRRQIGVSLVQFTDKSPIPPRALKTVVQGSASEALQNIASAMLVLPASSEGAATPLADALFRTLLATLQAPPPAPQRRALTLYQEICLFLQEHVQANISRNFVAANFRLSPNHVSRLFKNEGLISFNDYVNYTRINRAKHLLKLHRQSLDEIATACGYSDASYFCRVFKKMTKTTPSAYRQASSAANRGA